MDFIVTKTLCLILSSSSFYLTEQRKETACEMLEHVKQESIKNSIPPDLLVSLIYRESGWNKKAVSSRGACGLTQILPKYTGSKITGVPRYSCEDLKDPKTSISAGAKILSYWIHNYASGDVRVGLCGYNAGYRCKVTKKRKKPIAGGMRYADRVLLLKKRLESWDF